MVFGDLRKIDHIHWMITKYAIIISRFQCIYQKGDRRCNFDSHRLRRWNSAGQTDASKNDVFGSTETIMDSDNFCLKHIRRNYLRLSETIRAKFIRKLWCWSFSFSNIVVKKLSQNCINCSFKGCFSFEIFGLLRGFPKTSVDKHWPTTIYGTRWPSQVSSNSFWFE